ncbi:MAG: Peptidase [Candidatus Eremiobacteraeota bacterium]|nr:Peptidase [Candidatus Eremiobacteraeota bacterium]
MLYCGIVPPYLLDALTRHPDESVRDAAASTLEVERRLRSHAVTAPVVVAERAAGLRRLVYDCGESKAVPGRLRRREGEPATGDPDVDRAYDAFGTTYAFFRDVFGRNSLDGRGMHLIGSVHYRERFDNASWDGAEIRLGDGDGVVFRSFTQCLELVAHELVHGVVQAEGGLEYAGESGALNESLADVFGSLVKQWSLGQTACEADWIVGHGQFTPAVHGFGLRSLAAPGSAFDDPVLGKDPQPSHMDHFAEPVTHNADVHINSGIPNHAFYLFATQLGGRAWETAGRVWFDALCSGLHPSCSFYAFSKATLRAARSHGAAVVKALEHAWHGVGISRSAHAVGAD